MMQNFNMTRLLLFGFGGLAVITAGIIAYNVLVFRVTGTLPERDNFPTIAPYIDIYFSKPVSKVESFTFNGEENNGSITLDGKRLRFTYRTTYKDKQDYVLRLMNVTSKSGDRLNYSYAFRATYMDFKDVPKEIQQASIQKSSSGQVDDPFFNLYFPIQTPDFQIERPKNPGDNDKTLYVTFMSEVYNYDTNTRTALPNMEAEKMRTKVFEYIRSKGGKPEEYPIYYSNEYLNTKYPPKTSEYHD